MDTISVILILVLPTMAMSFSGHELCALLELVRYAPDLELRHITPSKSRSNPRLVLILTIPLTTDNWCSCPKMDLCALCYFKGVLYPFKRAASPC